jgi:murein DD-endopeptidase MepM/ murein hydrolase activator NlpD
MRFAERLSTIAGTATITSMVWIMIGAFWFNHPAPQAPQLAATGASGGERVATASAPQARAAGLVIPVAGVKAEQLTDTFNDSRSAGSRLHRALDIMAPRGTPVVAAAAGTVEKLFHSDAGGNTIYVRTPNLATIHYYAHLDRYAEGLREGQQVAQGQTLGTVGSTGDASADAPHLHFEIMQTSPNAKWYEPSTSIDPYPLLTGR